MQKLSMAIALVIFLSACGSSSSVSDLIGEKKGPDKFTQLRDIVESDLEQSSAVAVSVAIYQDGEVVFAEAFGEKVEGSGELATPDTLFQMGSTTKMFTGVAALQLMEQGLLKIDDNLVDVLPDIQYPGNQASNWEEVNIHHLLTHQSGFSDTYIGSGSTDQLSDYMKITYPLDNLQMNPPGLFFNYSNPSWSYLGAVVENLSEQTYSDYMLEQVFQPLGMARSSIGRSIAISDGDYALGSQNIDGSGQYLSDINQIPLNTAAEPAGSETWSTPTDVLKMAEFLLKGKPDFLSDERRIHITMPQISQDFAGLPMSYGYGIFVDEGFLYSDQWYPERIWHHAGNTEAYTSMFWVLPDQDIAVSIMSSGDFTNFDDTMVAALESVTSLAEPLTIPYGTVDTSGFDKHEGIYATGDFLVTVSQAGDNLEISVPALDANNIPYERTLYAIGGLTFVAVIENEEVFFTFVPIVEGGESVYMRNRNLVGIKLGY